MYKNKNKNTTEITKISRFFYFWLHERPSDTWRLVAKGLRKTGETVYDFGVAAENVTAEATEVGGASAYVGVF